MPPKRMNTTFEIPAQSKHRKTHSPSNASSSTHPPPTSKSSNEIDSQLYQKLLSFLILGIAKSRAQSTPKGFTPTQQERDVLFLEVFYEMNDSTQNYKVFTDAMQQPLKRVEFPQMIPVFEQAENSERTETYHALIEDAKKHPHAFPDVDLSKIDAVIAEKQEDAKLNDWLSEDDGQFDDDNEEEPEEVQLWRTVGIEIYRIEIGSFHSNPRYPGQYRLKVDAITNQLIIYCFEFFVPDLKDEEVNDINTLQKYHQFVVDCTKRFRQSRIFKIVSDLDQLEAIHFHRSENSPEISVLHLQWARTPKFYEKKAVLDDYQEISDFTLHQQASTHKKHTLVLKQDVNTDYLVGMMYSCTKNKPEIANLIRNGTAVSKFPSNQVDIPASTETLDKKSSSESSFEM